ncbi:MFS transporter [Ferrovum sp.]|uniref:AmpG family muropeptide MFS transporter n=1 Tax=Ferrovum sp. TaxID=2609467 RepID=UPI00260E7255|nr:MFS transporter [Ferrovum sp.]
MFAITKDNFRALGVVMLLGFSSGLPLSLSGATLQARMTTDGIALDQIGWITLVGLPYTLKFLWAPFLDRWRWPFLGRRRSWMLVTQVLTLVLIWSLGQADTSRPEESIAFWALLLALASATQDIVVDAYRTDILSPTVRGLGASSAMLGYRLAMLCAGAVALGMAAAWGWATTYEVMALAMGVGIMGTLWGKEPESSAWQEHSWQETFTGPWQDFFARSGAWPLLALVVLYKLGDALAFALSSAFLLRGLGFDLVQVGMVNKGVGLGATIAGSFVGGGLMLRWGLFRSLWCLGWIQGLATLSFMGLAAWGHHFTGMVGAVFLENFTSGMGTSAFAALLMSLCSTRYSATQFALLSALAALGRVLIGPFAGVLAQRNGWEVYFLVATLLALPGLVVLWRLRREIGALEQVEP